MGGRGALSTTGRRSVGAAAGKVLGESLARQTKYSKDTVGRVSYRGSNVFAGGEKTIDSFAKAVSRGNVPLEMAIRDVARDQLSAMNNLSYARDKINMLTSGKGKSEPRYYVRKAQEALDSARSTVALSNKEIKNSSIPDRIKVQITPTNSNNFKKEVKSVQKTVDEQLKKLKR